MTKISNIVPVILSAINAKDFEKAANDSSKLPKGHPLKVLCQGLESLYVTKNYEDACRLLSAAAKRTRSDTYITLALVDALLLSGKSDKAVSVLQQSLRANHNDPNLEIKLAFVLKELERNDAAQMILKNSVHSGKESHINALAFLHFSDGRYEIAADLYTQLTLISPNNPDVFLNLGNTLLKLKEHSKAERAFAQSANLGCQNKVELLSNLGIALEEQNKPTEAADCFQKAIAIAGNPQHIPDTAYHLSLNYLRTDRLKEGFALYDARFARSGVRPHNPPPNLAWWNGEATVGKLLLWSEQGIGDQILYTSAFDELLDHFRGQVDCIIEERLMTLVELKYPSINFLAKHSISHEDYDFHLPTGSIPRVLINTGNKLEWLKDKDYALRCESKYKSKPLRNRKLKIGISWYSSNKNLPGKNIDLTTFSSLVQCFGEKVSLVNLQYDQKDSDIRLLEDALGLQIGRKTADNKNDIAGLASEIESLDLVISVSNTTVHLAGFLGVPTILLASKYSGTLWYWELLTSASYSRWYPSVKVLKQDVDGDWSSLQPKLESYIND